MEWGELVEMLEFKMLVLTVPQTLEMVVGLVEPETQTQLVEETEAQVLLF
jgi:hypothetical protein